MNVHLHALVCLLLHFGQYSAINEISLHRVQGIACPYSAAWICDSNFLRKVKYDISWLKMERASFEIILSSDHAFQFDDDNQFFVNHLSGYEHLTRKEYGYNISLKNASAISKSAISKECELATSSTAWSSVLAILPFFGGLPPDVSENLEVKSIGQGNSLVSSNTKAIQCVAAVCSCLKYFKYVVVGYCRDKDRDILVSQVNLVIPHSIFTSKKCE